ncbi:MAG: hypothetical protein PHV28_00070 [Kiritimatiellae bacterium]|nr:hypothetical protein [Kiritimatiellia bacterium]
MAFASGTTSLQCGQFVSGTLSKSIPVWGTLLSTPTGSRFTARRTIVVSGSVATVLPKHFRVNYHIIGHLNTTPYAVNAIFIGDLEIAAGLTGTPEFFKVKKSPLKTNMTRFCGRVPKRRKAVWREYLDRTEK